MKTELLILIPDDESFCSSKKAFIDFMRAEALLSISGQKITYRRTAKSKDIISAQFHIDTNKVKSNQERYFLLTLTTQNEDLIDEFNDLCDRIRSIAERISPGKTTINTLWDDVGRIYAEKSYPLINEVENLMRRLIAKFMLITVGVNWSKDAIHPELFKKIENFDETEPYLNDLYKLDFIHLKQVLFEKKRDISLEELDRLLIKTEFNDNDKERIKKYIPKSNWEKYFSSLIDDKESSLDKKWELLYKLRNKVAHNRHVKKDEYEKIKGLSSQIKDIINKASAKLGEINLNEEDRELIIHTYHSDSPAAIGFLSEKAAAEFYIKSGYEVFTREYRQAIDFVAVKDGEKIGVEVKSIRPRHFMPIIKTSFIGRGLMYLNQMIDGNQLTKAHIVIVLRDDEFNYPIERVIAQAIKINEELGERFEIRLGRLNEEGAFVLLQE